jgi:hypothetical protein
MVVLVVCSIVSTDFTQNMLSRFLLTGNMYMFCNLLLVYLVYSIAVIIIH